jgi:ligand-binding SRPBCC domain-containing protein
MKLRLATQVDAPLSRVWEGFGAKLFEALSPPFPKVRLLRFEGSQKGNWVEIELHFILFKSIWLSEITEQKHLDGEIYFIDEGRKLPFPLRRWKHRHSLVAEPKGGTWIVDEIEYHSFSPLLDALLYVPFYLQFAYRKPIYRRFFG